MAKMQPKGLVVVAKLDMVILIKVMRIRFQKMKYCSMAQKRKGILSVVQRAPATFRVKRSNDNGSSEANNNLNISLGRA